MTNQTEPPKTPDTELAEILESYHRHNCHSMQAWFKGQTRPFPCDCDIVETAAALTAWRDRAVAEAKEQHFQAIVPDEGPLEGTKGTFADGYSKAVEDICTEHQRQLTDGGQE